MAVLFILYVHFIVPYGRFCSECKSKVLLAYSILVGEVDHTQEKGYCAALYEQLSCCAKERHVHVYNDTEFIAHLLEKAEPEFLGGSVPGSVTTASKLSFYIMCHVPYICA